MYLNIAYRFETGAISNLMASNIMKRQTLKQKCACVGCEKTLAKSIYLAATSDGKHTALRVRSSAIAFWRNSQSTTGKTMQKLTRTC